LILLNKNAAYNLGLPMIHHAGKRKPSPDFYLHAVDHLNIDPGNCIFIDDRFVIFCWLLLLCSNVYFLTCFGFFCFRKVNVEAALSVGMVGLHFTNAEVLKNELCSLGVELAPLVLEGETEVQ
jgi:FMN phosphatase YigB (HAD superfamily)